MTMKTHPKRPAYAIRTGLVFEEPVSSVRYALLTCRNEPDSCWLEPAEHVLGPSPKIHCAAPALCKQLDQKHEVIGLSDAIELGIVNVGEGGFCVGIDALALILRQGRLQAQKVTAGAGGRR